MTQKEIIRQEIERQRDISATFYEELGTYRDNQRAKLCQELLDFIDSLPEEKPPEDLELTWEDMRAIRIIKDHLTASINDPMWDSKEFYEEILRRFNKAKNKK